MNPGKNMSLDELKSWNTDLVNELRNDILVSGYNDGTNTWGTSPTDVVNLNGVCTLIALGLVTSTQTWRDLNNIDHVMTPTQLVTLAGGMALFIKTCYSVSWTHKAAIAAFDNILDLQDYDVTTGWPS